MAQTMYDECYLVMSEYGIQRMTKRKGAIQRGEIAVKVRLVVPVSAFAEPDVQVVIAVPESSIITPTVQVTALPAEEPVE